ncbi:two-component system, chemotaxis family, sensor kinase CheA [Methylomarinovum caldicuralii]|uniref:Chemotaxis protein CheA n=1 Tax=Methylomarinovum caldicuralii TaxID=438856 RepID=A0AAU9BZ38_9GAMM|nr:chemotaxis protein CheA [Methylomarinovum caldicuralii]BCX81595.1 two-component system, chemotaxis family, sensor kinase CheA [Methylomarinovum caldicuralii]
MAIDLNDEILQDFLVEASEILEQLGEQLVDLEQSTEDADLLNAIFRGFHTVKGGAGFLGITALVDLCHKAEDVFNVLRQGERKVSPPLMDAVLKALDVINDMMAQIRAGEEPEAADPELLETLLGFATPESEETEAPAPESSVPESEVEAPAAETQAAADPVEAEFEAMLEAAEGKQTGGDDEITEEEFEQLLDALHGEGGAPGKPKKTGPAPQKPEAGDSDEITEEEFEALLDQLHGPGKFRGAPEKTAAPAAQPAPKPAAQDKPKTPQSTAEKPASAKKEPRLKVVGGADAHKPQKPQGESTVRVDTQRLDEIMNMVGELVLVRNRFKTLGALLDNEEMAKAVANLDVVTSDLQLAVMKTRMQPIKKVFGRFPRVVRDLARSLKKEVRLEMQGEETDLDKNLVESLADPLIHLVRNAVDHGIEMPDEREKAGKPREGTVLLTAAQEGDHIELTIEDDGKGMDPEVLRRKAVEKGLMDGESAARMSDKECYQIIFMPGFSTKSEISDISGRGVGMDVVKTRIDQMNGSVEVDSVKGKGTKIAIKVPLTLAIMPTLMVKLEDQAFALPLASVVEILDLDLDKTNVVDGQEVVIVRDQALPLFHLKHWLIHGGCSDGDCYGGHVVVVNVGGRHAGFVVDHLIGQEEVVVKPLGAKLHGLDGLAGATITGDGMIALILDVPSLMKRYAA